MNTLTAFVRGRYMANKYRTHYTFKEYSERQQHNDVGLAWIESQAKDKEISLDAVRVVARHYVGRCGFEPSALPRLLASLMRVMNCEIPAIEGILTAEYWVEYFAGPGRRCLFKRRRVW